MRRSLIAAAAAALALQTGSAAACGGLVAPNGSVRLERATTLVDWHQGMEHYLTNFSFRGDVSNLGWIVPLPAVPIRIEEGGAWTLQRLRREVSPPAPEAQAAAGAANLDTAAEVLQQVRVDALDITVLRGSGRAVIDWCAKNGFVLPDETRDHLLRYAQASPIFMAARYDIATARTRHLSGGDGTPLLITMPTPHPWVPLEILANDDGAVDADLYLLSDEPLRTGQEPAWFSSPVGDQLPGATGFVVRFQEQIGDALRRDLSSDRNMGWVRPGSWLTYLTLDAPSESVTYDLSVTPAGDIRLAGFGGPPARIAETPPAPPFAPAPTPAVALAVALGSGLLLAALTAVAISSRRRPGQPGMRPG